MRSFKKLSGAAALAIVAATLAFAAPPAFGKSPVAGGAYKAKTVKGAVFICTIGHRPNIVVLRNHNGFKIPRGAKIFFVASNATNVVAQGSRTLRRTLRPGQRVCFSFNKKRVKYYGRPTSCRAYARWVA